MDAGSDAAIPCGTTVCDPSQVCCVKKAPVGAACIPPSEFVADGCEKLDLPCSAPADCPGGLACCFVFSLGTVTCVPAQVCPGDMVNTDRVCSVDSDCPHPIIGGCVPFLDLGDGGTLNVCTP
jgi:hypothetical protein